MTPCTELLAIEAIEEMLSPPLILLSLPERIQIGGAGDTEREDRDDDEDSI